MRDYSSTYGIKEQAYPMFLSFFFSDAIAAATSGGGNPELSNPQLNIRASIERISVSVRLSTPISLATNSYESSILFGSVAATKFDTTNFCNTISVGTLTTWPALNCNNIANSAVMIYENGLIFRELTGLDIVLAINFTANYTGTVYWYITIEGVYWPIKY